MWTVVSGPAVSGLFQHYHDGRQLNERQEVRGLLLVACRHTAKLFSFRPEALDQISLFVGVPVILARFQAVLLLLNIDNRELKIDRPGILKSYHVYDQEKK